MKQLIAMVFLVLTTLSGASAQCAMCRTQLENNVSNGDIGIAAGINIGIIYLLVMPYLAILIIGYFWYRNSNRNDGEKLKRGVA